MRGYPPNRCVQRLVARLTLGVTRMETVGSKIKICERHPFLTLLVALAANLFFVFPFGLIGSLVQERNPPPWLLEVLTCVFFASVFSIFAAAFYMTGWGAESRLLRLAIMLSGGILMMIFWFIGVLILVFLGMGYLARLYS